MKKVKELSNIEAAKMALHVYGAGGMQPVVRRLAYLSMIQDEEPSDAFKSLSYMLSRLFREQDGPLDLAVGEYAGTLLKEDKDAEGWETLRQRQMLRRDSYKLYTSVSSNGDTQHTPWDHPAEFKFQQEQFDQLIQRATKNTGKLDLAWRAFRISTGLEGGAIKHRTKGTDVSFDELFQESDFVSTDEFLEFLEQENFVFLPRD